MATSATIEIAPLVRAFNRRAYRAAKDYRSQVVVGYSAPYALFVHENLEAHHPVGQAKFLEQPAREFRKDMAAAVVAGLKAGQSLTEAQLAAGRVLLRESQKLVPVDTGLLKRSGYADVVGGGGAPF
jgi:CRISPR/Cas system-associated exonuclease Cas4 (RecB family)